MALSFGIEQRMKGRPGLPEKKTRDWEARKVTSRQNRPATVAVPVAGKRVSDMIARKWPGSRIRTEESDRPGKDHPLFRGRF